MTTRKYWVLAAAALAVAGFIAYAVTRRSAPPDARDTAADAAEQPAVPSITADNPLAPAPPQAETVRLMFVGVPKDAFVTIDGTEVDSALAYVEPRKQPRLIAVKQRGTQLLFDAKSVVVDQNATIDFTTKQLSDCDQQLTSKTKLYCRAVFCERKPAECN
jgi:hypothetical protein